MKKLKTLLNHGRILVIIAMALIIQISTFAQSSSTQGPNEYMKVSLYQVASDGSVVLSDGNLTNYNDNFNDGLGDDALKMSNFGENFGIIREGTRLAIEQRKKIIIHDTTFFCMWNMQQRNYKLVISNKNLEHPGLIGFLEDAFLRTSTSLNLNDVNNIDFSVTSDAASYAIDRFKVVFKNPLLMPLPTTFTSFTADVNSTMIVLQWTVENENAIQEYIIEHSTDGISFSALQSVQPFNAGGTQSYISNDAVSRRGDNFYRIKAIHINGSVQYSSIIKVILKTPVRDFVIYPNPVLNRQMNILFPGQVMGKYSLQLYSSNGTMIPLGTVQVNVAQSIQTVLLPKTVAPGIYRIKIISPDNTITVKAINVL